MDQVQRDRRSDPAVHPQHGNGQHPEPLEVVPEVVLLVTQRIRCARDTVVDWSSATYEHHKYEVDFVEYRGTVEAEELGAVGKAGRRREGNEIHEETSEANL